MRVLLSQPLLDLTVTLDGKTPEQCAHEWKKPAMADMIAHEVRARSTLQQSSVSQISVTPCLLACCTHHPLPLCFHAHCTFLAIAVLRAQSATAGEGRKTDHSFGECDWSSKLRRRQRGGGRGREREGGGERGEGVVAPERRMETRVIITDWHVCLWWFGRGQDERHLYVE